MRQIFSPRLRRPSSVAVVGVADGQRATGPTGGRARAHECVLARNILSPSSASFGGRSACAARMGTTCIAVPAAAAPGPAAAAATVAAVVRYTGNAAAVAATEVADCPYRESKLPPLVYLRDRLLQLEAVVRERMRVGGEEIPLPAFLSSFLPSFLPRRDE